MSATFAPPSAKWLRPELLSALQQRRPLAPRGRPLQVIACYPPQDALPAPRLLLSDTFYKIDAYPTEECLRALLLASGLEELCDLEGATLEVHGAALRCAWGLPGGAAAAAPPAPPPCAQPHPCLQVTALTYRGGAGNSRFGKPRALSEDQQVSEQLLALAADPQALAATAAVLPHAEVALWAALGAVAALPVPLARFVVPYAAEQRHRALLAGAAGGGGGGSGSGSGSGSGAAAGAATARAASPPPQQQPLQPPPPPPPPALAAAQRSPPPPPPPLVATVSGLPQWAATQAQVAFSPFGSQASQGSGHRATSVAGGSAASKGSRSSDFSSASGIVGGGGGGGGGASPGQTQAASPTWDMLQTQPQSPESPVQQQQQQQQQKRQLEEEQTQLEGGSDTEKEDFDSEGSSGEEGDEPMLLAPAQLAALAKQRYEAGPWAVAFSARSAAAAVHWR